jgi:dihydrofolate synthase/folylpolyglutamate synthase
MRDKAIGEIATILFPVANLVIATQAENPRAASAREIVELGQPTQTPMVEESSVAAALERARVVAGAKGVVVITGSIYIVGEALRIFAQSKIQQSV